MNEHHKRRHRRKRQTSDLPPSLIKAFPWLGFAAPNERILSTQTDPYMRFRLNSDGVTAKMERSTIYPPEGTPSGFVLGILNLQSELNLSVLEVTDAEVFDYSGISALVHEQAEQIVDTRAVNPEEVVNLRYLLAQTQISQAAYRLAINKFSGKANELVLLPKRRWAQIEGYKSELGKNYSSPFFKDLENQAKQKGLNREQTNKLLQAYLLIEKMSYAYLALLTGEVDHANKFFANRPDVYIALMTFIAGSVMSYKSDEHRRLTKNAEAPLGRVIYSLENAETSVGNAVIDGKKINLAEGTVYMSGFSRLLVALSDFYFLLKAGDHLKSNGNYLSIPLIQPFMKLRMIEDHAFSIRNDQDNQRLIQVINQSLPGRFSQYLNQLLNNGQAVAQKTPKSGLRSFLGSGKEENYQHQLHELGVEFETLGLPRSDIVNTLLNYRLATDDVELAKLSTFTDIIDFARARIFVQDHVFNPLIGYLVKDNPQVDQPLSRYGQPLPRIYFYNSQTRQRVEPKDMPRNLPNPLAEIKNLYSKRVFSTIFVRVPFNIPGYKEPFNLEIELFPASVQQNVDLARNQYVQYRTFKG